MEVECPTCERDDFKSERGMKIHHEAKHGESLRDTYICDFCGDEFYRSEGGEYCGMECFSEARKGEGNPMYEVERPESHRKELREKMSGSSNPMFSATGSDNPRWRERREQECTWCGQTFRTIERDRKFCSLSCMGDWRSCHWNGSEHPAWRDDSQEVPMGANWEEKREEALIRDEYECIECDMSNESHRRKIGKGLDVHHIVPRREFWDKETGELDYERANRLENLITLCRKHHRKIEVER